MLTDVIARKHCDYMLFTWVCLLSFRQLEYCRHRPPNFDDYRHYSNYSVGVWGLFYIREVRHLGFLFTNATIIDV